MVEPMVLGIDDISMFFLMRAICDLSLTETVDQTNYVGGFWVVRVSWRSVWVFLRVPEATQGSGNTPLSIQNRGT